MDYRVSRNQKGVRVMDYMKGNKEAWEEAFERRDPAWGLDIARKIRSERYPFLEKDTLPIIERLGLKGKAIGQFCSNNGRELLSLMQSGAVEGIGFDIAENQVAFANAQALELGLNCKFVATNILDIGEDYRNRFDFILITIGALCWFKDLDAFFAKVSACLKPGGTLLINEQHPVTNMLGAPGEEEYLEAYPATLVNDYFYKEWTGNDGMYYIAQKAYRSKTFTDYSHPLSEILNAMIRAGLELRGLQEFDYDISGMFSALNGKGIPLSCIIEARKAPL
jgi:SAM-dependent methyltransferase